MGRKHSEFSYSEPSDTFDVLLRHEPEDEEEEEDDDKDDDEDDEDEEENDGYSVCLTV
jgi:hypothetical protein